VGAPTVGTLTFPGLAAGASSSATISWATAGLAIGVHNLLATQKYADNNTSNNSRAAGVTISSPSVHVGNLDGVATVTSDSWSAAVTITAHDAKHRPLPGVTVTGNWFTTTSVNAQCVTNDTGTCTLSLAALPLTLRAVSYSVSGMTLTGFAYKMASNHDPDGSSNGYSIAVRH